MKHALGFDWDSNAWNCDTMIKVKPYSNETRPELTRGKPRRDRRVNYRLVDDQLIKFSADPTPRLGIIYNR